MIFKIILMVVALIAFLVFLALIFLIIRSGNKLTKTLDEIKKSCDEANEIARSWMRGGTDDQLPKG